MYHLVILGAGPSGIFAALNTKKSVIDKKIVILEKSSLPLYKLKLSGGGRCNLTNATFDPKELSKNYPRGNLELISAFNKFGPKEMINWLEKRKVFVKIEQNKKVFPQSNSSQTLIDLFLKELKEKSIEIKFNQNILKIFKKSDFFELIDNEGNIIQAKNLLLATGSSTDGLEYAKMLGHSFEKFIPSLFSLKISSDITKLTGLSYDNVKVSIKNTQFSNAGSLLITHEGFSGPAIINLTSFGAKYLHENNYKATLVINWLNDYSKQEALDIVLDLQIKYPKKTIFTLNPFKFPSKLFEFFIKKFEKNIHLPLQNISKKNLALFIEKLTSDEYLIISKSQNKSEFVSCGGINLKEINFKDMQSKICKNLYFTGELLNIDAITGGFNLQNAWTTAFIAAESIK